MLLDFIAVILGFTILIKSADLFVDGSVVLAKKLHIDERVIGITLVALGTSLPELFVNLSVRQRDLDDALFGNVLGSNLFNLLLILGLQATIRPLTSIDRKLISFDLPLAWVLVAMLWVFSLSSTIFSGGASGFMSISPWEGWLLSGLYIFFILKQYWDYRQQKNNNATPEEKIDQSGQGWMQKYFYIFIFLGIVGLYGGSEITVANAVALARGLGLSEAFIGIFILSVGTSLPELITLLVALRKKYDQLALGNVLGSNICNIGLVLAIYAWFTPIHYNPQFNFTFLVLIFMTGYLFMALMLKKKKDVSRVEGVLFISTYIVYVVYSYSQGL